jgi:hypothetical protein
MKEQIPHQLQLSDDILGRDPAITTNDKDAVYRVHFLDDFNPATFKSIDSLERTPEGFHIFEPGLYRFDVQSFCLKAATFAPRDGGKGDGYLYAPTKGPRADIVKKIIRRSFDHPEITQRQIQVLLWAVISYTKLTDMPRDRQLTAAELLTAEEMLEINDGALGLIPEDLIGSAFDKLPSEIGDVLRAEAKLRNTFAKTRSTYEDFERIAILSGEPPRIEGEDIPYGLWSLRPEGFFIRYFPQGYTETRVEIYVPELFQIRLDELGRITSLADENGNVIETTYDDSVEPIEINNEPSLKGYGFGHIRFGRVSVPGEQEKREAEWSRRGWTLVGIPASGKLSGNMNEDRFAGLEERYEWAQRHISQLEELDKQFNPQGDLELIMNLGHYSYALNAALDTEEKKDNKWIDEHLDIVKKAWQFSVWLREMYNGAYTETGREYFGNDAVPRGPTGKQRLAMRLFVNKMNLHDYPGFRGWLDEMRKTPPPKPMFIVGVVR